MAWTAKPVLRIILNRSVRTRVLVVYGNEVVLLQGWLGKSHWSLPGGGIARYEDKVTCAIREVDEEIGIKIVPDQLQYLGQRPSASPDPKVHHPIEYFFVKLDTKLPIKITRPWEILEARWFDLNNMPNGVSQTAQAALSLARDYGLLR